MSISIKFRAIAAVRNVTYTNNTNDSHIVNNKIKNRLVKKKSQLKLNLNLTVSWEKYFFYDETNERSDLKLKKINSILLHTTLATSLLGTDARCDDMTLLNVVNWATTVPDTFTSIISRSP